jgi:hypothetical protein
MAWHEQLLVCEPTVPDVRAIWLQRDNDAVLAACNRVASLQVAAEPLRISLPDGSKLQADVAGLAMRFRKSSAGWTPTALHAVRAGEMELDGRPLHGTQVEHSIDVPLN